MYRSPANFFRRYMLPGFVFQSVIVGGGYGTGREIAEFFLGHGPVGGLMGMCVSALGWSVVLAIAFEFARLTKSYDYRSFFKALLGKSWFLFELIYLLITFLVLAVIGSAASEMVSSSLGIDGGFGVALLFISVAILAYYGSSVIEKALSYWSFLLYAVYAIFFIWIVSVFGEQIAETFDGSSNLMGAWHVDGLRYAAYNLNALAATLFVIPVLTTRKQAIRSGMIAGFIGIVPGIFVFVAMLARYPEVVNAPVPITTLLVALNADWFMWVFQIVLFGTFVETSVGMIHAINERIATASEEKNRIFTDNHRLGVAITLLVSAVFLAKWFGIISLIAQGYGFLSYLFIAIVILPLMTVGIARIIRHSRHLLSSEIKK